MRVIELIRTIKKAALTPPTDQPSENLTSIIEFMLKQAKQKLVENDAKKYPAQFFQYHYFPLTIDKKELQVTYVKSLKPLDEQIYSSFENETLVHAFKARRLSIIAGILHAIKFSRGANPPYLGINNDAKIDQVADHLGEYLNEEIVPNVNTIDIDVFLKTVAKKLKLILNLTEEEILNQIRTAERYFVAEYKSNQLLMNETTAGIESYCQVDEYFTKLTERQKQELMLIHQPNPPGWFSYLPAWEQQWFLNIIPTNPKDDWSIYENLSQSSAMSHIPGIQNARMNSLVKVGEQQHQLISRAFRTATMVPYELHADKETLFSHTEDSALQVLEHLAEQLKNEVPIWKGIDLNGLKPIIFVQSLLSDIAVAKEDKRLAKNQKLAVRKIHIENRIPSALIIVGNDPMNFLRYAAALNGKLSEASGRWKHSDILIDYATKFIAIVEKQTLNLDQTTCLELVKQAKNSLQDLKETSLILKRNFVAYKVAYSSLIVEKTGGITTISCKSGKDRTAVAELYANAMQIYFDQYHCLPQLGDTGEKRENFVRIIVELFNSMMEQEAAANNTPGSFGLKLDSTTLCGDIIAELMRLGTYNLSDTLGNSNKPEKFIVDEAKQARNRSKSIKSSPLSPRIARTESSPPLISHIPPTLSIDKTMEKDIAELRKSTILDSESLNRELDPLVASIAECNANPDLIPQWNFQFNKLKKAIKKIGDFKKEIQKIEIEINTFIQENKELNHPAFKFLPKLLADSHNLFLRINGNLFETIETVRFIQLPIIRDQFEIAKNQVLEAQASCSSPVVKPDSPKSSQKPSSEKVKDSKKAAKPRKGSEITLPSGSLPKKKAPLTQSSIDTPELEFDEQFEQVKKEYLARQARIRSSVVFSTPDSPRSSKKAPSSEKKEKSSKKSKSSSKKDLGIVSLPPKKKEPVASSSYNASAPQIHMQFEQVTKQFLERQSLASSSGVLSSPEKEKCSKKQAEPNSKKSSGISLSSIEGSPPKEAPEALSSNPPSVYAMVGFFDKTAKDKPKPHTPIGPASSKK